MISFGIAPAILSFAWGLQPLGRLGLGGRASCSSARAAMRLARFNIQSAGGGDKRYFVGMPSPAAAGDSGGHGVSRIPKGSYDYRAALPALAMVLVPARADGEHDPVPQLQDARPAERAGPYTVLIFVAAGIMLIATHPRFVLVVMAYSYLRVGVHRDGDRAAFARTCGASVAATRPTDRRAEHAVASDQDHVDASRH